MLREQAELPFKRISPENWLEPDPASINNIGNKFEAGQIKPFDGEDWVQYFLTPQLNDTVPEEIHKLFEAARGILCYGYLFYPLYTMGANQLYRVVDASTVHRCKSLNAPQKKRDSFKKRIAWLAEQGIIPQNELIRWQALRKLRNTTSHPETHFHSLPQGCIIEAELINQLYPN